MSVSDEPHARGQENTSAHSTTIDAKITRLAELLGCLCARKALRAEAESGTSTSRTPEEEETRP